MPSGRFAEELIPCLDLLEELATSPARGYGPSLRVRVYLSPCGMGHAHSLRLRSRARSGHLVDHTMGSRRVATARAGLPLRLGAELIAAIRTPYALVARLLHRHRTTSLSLTL